MPKSKNNSELVDSYLRNKLKSDEVTAFETALLESPELQLELETAMGIRQIVLLEAEPDHQELVNPLQELEARNNWQPLALAASVVLAVFSTTMYWKVSNEARVLQSEVAALNQPHTSVLTIPVDIMRSAGDQIPDIIVQKPPGNALVILDVELSPAVAAEDELRMSLRDLQAAELIAWDSGKVENGRITAAIDSRILPDGKVWLEMANKQGQVIDRRLLEFLP